MRRATVFGLFTSLLMAMFTLTACPQTPQTGSGGMPQNTRFLSGGWSGTISVTTPGLGTWGFEMHILHYDNDISGSAVMVAGAKRATGSFSGTVSNPVGAGTIKFTLKVPSNEADWLFNMSGVLHVYYFTGTYTDKEIKGTWSNPNTEASGKFAVYPDN